MRLLLEADHYVDDQLLEKGQEVGDGEKAVHDWLYHADVKSIGKKAGQLRPISRAMSGIDKEGQDAVKRAFGEEKVSVDPTAAIPIQGTTNAPGLAQAKGPALSKGI